jgi:hypothetical protein
MNKELAKYAKNGDKKNFQIAYELLFGNSNKKAWETAYATARAGSQSLTAETAGTTGGFDMSGMISKFTTKTFKITNEATKLVGKAINDVYQSQMGVEESDSTAQKLAELLEKSGANPAALIGNATGLAYDEAIEQLKKESTLLSEVNAKTGISGELSEALQQDMKEASIEAKRYGFSLSNIGELYTGLVDNSGKFAFINRSTMESAAPVAMVLGKTMGEMATIMGDYETIGVGVNQTIKNLDEAATKSISLGMSARKVTETMSASMSKLNEYGFKNGVKGLEDMSRKALEFRMNMDSVFSIADKVFDATSAIDFTANMQVLGGAIGDFNDPLKLMYMATNNVEGLQDALVGAAGSLATYNQEQGRFEVTSVNLRKSKEMAQQMGISMGELNKIAIAAAERSSAAASLMSSGLNMPEKDREFLTNISRMENGEMKIVVPKSLQDQLGLEPIKLEELTEAQKEVLIKNQEAFEKMDSSKIAMSQLTETQQISRQVDVIAAYVKVRGAAYVKGMTSNLTKTFQDEFKESITKLADTKKVNLNEDKKSGQELGVKINNVMNSPEKQQEIIDGLKDKKNEAVQNGEEYLKKLMDGFKTSFNDSMGDKYDKTRTINLQYNVDSSNPREFTQVKMA